MKLKPSKTLKSVFLFLLSFHFVSCTFPSKKFQLETAGGRFQYAKFLEGKLDYEQALIEYNKVKNNHSYSPYSRKAALKIADVHYKSKDFVEAEVAYQFFKELYPEHPRVDYVIFRLGMSHFKQAPKSVDRDLSSLHQAIKYFEQLLSSYKKSAVFKKAEAKRNESLRRLSGKEEYIARFYFKKKFYDSALRRYEKLFETYPKFGKKPKTLFYAFLSAYYVKKKALLKKHYGELQSLYPQSKEAKKAKRQFHDKL